MAHIDSRSDSRISLRKDLVGYVAGALVIAAAALVYVLARQLGWTLGWLYLGIVAVGLVINVACLLRWNPTLIRRRMQIGQGTKTWDLVWSGLFAPLIIGIGILAVMELRETGPSAPGIVWLVGLAIFAPGWALVTRAMVVNPFFEKTVRIQEEHGHHVVDRGPYAYVRHPGYLGMAGWLVSTPLLLASTWAITPTVFALIGLVARTALEDRTLTVELPGYAEYRGRVRFRLIPGVW